jgi:hypothetical protein
MKRRVLFASCCAACALAIGTTLPAAAEDKSPTPVTQDRANAPSKSQSVAPSTTRSSTQAPVQPTTHDPKGQVRSDAPVPTRPGPRVASPTEVKPDQATKRQALDKKATQARAYPLAAQIVLLPESPPSISPTSPVAAFCRGGDGTRFGIVRLRYVWRPGPVDGVRDALLVVRRSTGEVSKPVQLGPVGGEVEIGRATAPLTGLLGFSKADLCPSGCTEVRLAPRTRAHANRFDQRWQRACLVARFAPTPVR